MLAFSILFSSQDCNLYVLSFSAFLIKIIIFCSIRFYPLNMFRPFFTQSTLLPSQENFTNVNRFVSIQYHRSRRKSNVLTLRASCMPPTRRLSSKLFLNRLSSMYHHVMLPEGWTVRVRVAIYSIAYIFLFYNTPQ